jgi:hypothetical protein
MAAKLGQLLIDNGLIVPAQLEQALQAQLVFGGRLGTNLVELGFISTATLAAFLAQQLTIPSLRPGDLDGVDPAALKLIDGELAARHLVFPLSVDKRRLRLAMADPTDLTAADEIAFRTGYGVDAVVAPELLVLYALERFYGEKKASRFVRLADTMREAAESFASSAVAQGGDGEAPMDAPPRRKGPYSLKQASEDLVSCQSYAGILEVLRRLLASDLERIAIFVIEGGAVRGWSHKRCTVPSEILRDGVHDPFRKIEVPLDGSRLFARVIRAGRPILEPLRVDRPDRIVAKALGVGPEDPVLGFTLRAGSSIAAVVLAVGERKQGALARRERFDVLVSKFEDAIQFVHLRKRILSG